MVKHVKHISFNINSQCLMGLLNFSFPDKKPDMGDHDYEYGNKK